MNKLQKDRTLFNNLCKLYDNIEQKIHAYHSYILRNPLKYDEIIPSESVNNEIIPSESLNNDSDICIPLMFWFNRDPRDAIPLGYLEGCDKPVIALIPIDEYNNGLVTLDYDEPELIK